VDPTVRWVVLLVAADDIDAQLVAGRLAEDDIPSFLDKDRTGYGDYLLGGSNPHAPVTVLVPEEHLAEALELVSGGEQEREGEFPDEPGDVEILAERSTAFGVLRTLRWWVAVLVIGVMIVFLLESNPLDDLLDL
jgi:hypothetical protein